MFDKNVAIDVEDGLVRLLRVFADSSQNQAVKNLANGLLDEWGLLAKEEEVTPSDASASVPV